MALTTNKNELEEFCVEYAIALLDVPMGSTTALGLTGLITLVVNSIEHYNKRHDNRINTNYIMIESLVAKIYERHINEFYIKNFKQVCEANK